MVVSQENFLSKCLADFAVEYTHKYTRTTLAQPNSVRLSKCIRDCSLSRVHVFIGSPRFTTISSSLHAFHRTTENQFVWHRTKNEKLENDTSFSVMREKKTNNNNNQKSLCNYDDEEDDKKTDTNESSSIENEIKNTWDEQTMTTATTASTMMWKSLHKE